MFFCVEDVLYLRKGVKLMNGDVGFGIHHPWWLWQFAMPLTFQRLVWLLVATNFVFPITLTHLSQIVVMMLQQLTNHLNTYALIECGTFHENIVSYMSSYSRYFREPHWFSLVFTEIFRVTLTVLYISYQHNQANLGICFSFWPKRCADTFLEIISLGQLCCQLCTELSAKAVMRL